MESIITNFGELSQTPLRRAAFSIAEAGLRAINTRAVLEKLVRFQDGNVCFGDKVCSVPKIKRIFLVGVGKCATEAVSVLSGIFGDKISAGIVIDVKSAGENWPSRIKHFTGTHPMPSEKNVEATKKLLDFLSGFLPEDLVIFAISGGGSTLLCLPEAGMRVSDEQKLLGEMFRVGAPITEINTVRKHLSAARGGGLARAVYPAQAVVLIFSDVIGNDIGLISSGPTVRDKTTVADARAILEKYSLVNTCGIDGCGLVETPKEEKYFEKVTNILAVSNALALQAMRDEAEKLGFKAKIVTDKIQGEARDVAEEICRKLHGEKNKTALLYGGETTVTVDRHGKGGRNGELALSALRFVEDGELVAAVASDGRDNGPLGGALADTLGRQKSETLGLNIAEHLANHDPEPFFEKTGDYLMTGDTGSNVSDLLIALKE